MKEYIKPKIEEVSLDNNQAILQICRVSGAYFGGGGRCYSSGTHGVCASAVRAVAGNYGSYTTQNQGS